MFIDRISIELISIERVSFENRIVLVFKVLPYHFSGLLANTIKGNLETNASLRIDSITIDGSFITV